MNLFNFFRSRPDIVYIVDNNGFYLLKYSLRSLAHIKDKGKIFIVGAIPDFVTNVQTIPVKDSYTRDGANVINKLLTACKDPRISNNFLFMHDDFFIIKDISIKNLPNYARGDFAGTPRLKSYHPLHHNLHTKKIKKTFDLLKTKGLPTINFELHCPMLINKKKYIKIISQYDWLKTAYANRSLYCNTLKLKPTWMQDYKINSVYASAAIKKNLKDRWIFSFGDVTFYDELRRFIQNLFPHKSQYEK